MKTTKAETMLIAAFIFMGIFFCVKMWVKKHPTPIAPTTRLITNTEDSSTWAYYDGKWQKLGSCMGKPSGLKLTTGSSNVIIGHKILTSITTSSNNTMIK